MPDAREVKAHDDRCGGKPCAPWLVREVSAEADRRETVHGVVWLCVYKPGTADESVDSWAENVVLVQGRTYEFCALSHDGTPMPRVEVKP